MLKIRLPETIMECAAMRSLWRETIYICLILNDVYSVQKEIVSQLWANTGLHVSNLSLRSKAHF